MQEGGGGGGGWRKVEKGAGKWVAGWGLGGVGWILCMVDKGGG